MNADSVNVFVKISLIFLRTILKGTTRTNRTQIPTNANCHELTNKVITKANDEKDRNGLRSLPQERFLEWLDTHLNLDSKMSVDNRIIEIGK